MAAKTNKQPLFKDGEYKVEKVVELSFFALTTDKNVGSSNKSYHIELHLPTSGNKAQIYSMFGAVGGTQQQDWRYYDSIAKAEKEFESIIKSKKKKGYRECDVAVRALGSQEAKKITKAIQLTNIDKENQIITSTLHPKVQYLVKELFGETDKWIINTFQSPLGQLTIDQVNLGRNFLAEAKIINDKKHKTASDKTKIEKLTNDFYTAIPHNLGMGARGTLTHLLLDDATKIAQKEADLDTLLDAKSVGAVMAEGSLVDDQYKSLNADFEYIEESDKLFKWIDDLVQKTRASNHHYLGKIKLLNVWKMKRNGEQDRFLDAAKSIAKNCSGQIIPDMYKKLSVSDRNDVLDNELYQKANVLPLFHGTKTENLIGITKQGLLIRPHNVVLCGSMYGNGVYNGFSSKSINYSSIHSSYWAKGNASKAFLFITDTILGNSKIASGPYSYSKSNIKPNHSVWAKGGLSGVINDEFITYDVSQVSLRYLIEFTC